MAKKTLGYINLIWTCPRCSTQNPGPQKFCNGCGGPQPADVQFEPPAEAKLITDQAAVAQAKAGPDVHCPYCGARNPGGAKFCGACGGDLTGAKAREAGKVLGAYHTGPAAPVHCPSCGTANPASTTTCSNCGASLAQPAPAAPPAATPAAGGRKFPIAVAGIGLVVLCALAAVVFLLTGRTRDIVGQVQSVSWTRSVDIEGLGPVEHQAWRDEIPGGAQIGDCSLEYRFTQDQPAPNATEVCGTPYTMDTGTGAGQVVQDCVYDVYDEQCSYTSQEWTVVDTLQLSGSDLVPTWPEIPYDPNRREGATRETFHVTFSTSDRAYDYEPATETEFQQFAIGSAWTLRVNALGGVTAVEPAR
jgi:predicted nucleic acid-binding Zn ribbon protein